MRKLLKIASALIILTAFTNTLPMNRPSNYKNLSPHRVIQRLLAAGGMSMISVGSYCESEDIAFGGVMLTVVGAALCIFDNMES